MNYTMLTAIIVDDEAYCSETLSMLLDKYCPDVHVLAVCHSGEEALKQIQAKQPQLVFLDIEMPHMNGFELLEEIPEINFELIFTTSYDQYAIKAIRFSALDYLLKPIDREELVDCCEQCYTETAQAFSSTTGNTASEVSSIISTCIKDCLSYYGRPAYDLGGYYYQL